MSVTDWGATFVEIDIGTTQELRPYWEWSRSAGDIARTSRPGALRTKNAWLVPGGAWLLRPAAFDPSALATAEYEPSVIGPAVVQLAEGMGRYYKYRRPDDLAGIAADASLVAQGINVFQKRVAASGATWATANLAADLAGFPMPIHDPAALIPMDRVLLGLETHGPNDGYMVNFGMPMAGVQDIPLVFYFGGPTDVRSPGGLLTTHKGGEYCLAFRSSGMAILFEKDGADWRQRDQLRFMPQSLGADPGGLSPAVMVIPWGRNNLVVHALTGSSTPDRWFSVGDVAEFAARMKLAVAEGSVSDYYREAPGAAAHRHTQHFTGQGNIRVDIQRDMRSPFMIARLKYPATGVVVDSPFMLPFTLPAGTPIYVAVETYLLTGTGVTYQLYNADTHAALATGSGGFLSHAGQRKYYLAITLQASAERYSTPAVLGYVVFVPKSVTTRTPAPITADVQRISITGPDWEPGHDQVTAQVTDETADLGILQLRDHIKSRVGIATLPEETLVTILHEGETVQAVGKLRGTPGEVYPAETWRDYELRIGSMWARLERKYTLIRKWFGSDSDAPPDPVYGFKPPWKITSVIRWLLEAGGWLPAEINIPDLPLRFWWGHDPKPEDLLIEMGSYIAPIIQKLAQDYLAATVIWDPNTSPSSWRLIGEPAAPYTNTLAHFHLTNPGMGDDPIDVTYLGSWAPGHCYVERGRYNSYVRAPEGNLVVVEGMTKNGARINAVRWNNPSITNPAHPDFLDEGVLPIIRKPDPALMTQQAVEYVAQVIYNRACHAQLLFEMTTPLMLVTDPLDPLQVRPRILRIGDLITVEGSVALVRNCNPIYNSDFIQHHLIEGRYLVL